MHIGRISLWGNIFIVFRPATQYYIGHWAHAHFGVNNQKAMRVIRQTRYLFSIFLNG